MVHAADDGKVVTFVFFCFLVFPEIWGNDPS